MNPFKNIKELPVEIPLFPLNNCLLLPKGNLKLNIFEPRYLNMTEDSISKDRIIGMIQTNENKQIYKVGCIGKIIQFTETKDQKYLIELSGICRYQIISSRLTDRGYNMAEVNYKNFIHDISAFKIKIDIKKFFIVLKNYFDYQNIQTDWDVINKAPLDLLIVSLAQSFPFNSKEKQMLIETKNINELALNMMSLLEINSAGETKILN